MARIAPPDSLPPYGLRGATDKPLIALSDEELMTQRCAARTPTQREAVDAELRTRGLLPRKPGQPQRLVRVYQHRTSAGPSPAISNANAACDVLQNLGYADRESFVALHLDARNRLIGVEEVAKGHLTGVEVHPREVFKGALLSNAAAIILAHNHPSGSPVPSPEDREITRRLISASSIIGIPIRDHLIVTPGRCTSLHAEEPDLGFKGLAGRRPSRTLFIAGAAILLIVALTLRKPATTVAATAKALGLLA